MKLLLIIILMASCKKEYNNHSVKGNIGISQDSLSSCPCNIQIGKYIIKKEKMGGNYYYMIYKRVLFWSFFFERWNSLESAKDRVQELRHPDSVTINF